MMQPVIEMVVFRQVADTSREELLALMGQVQNWLTQQPGYLRREISEVGDGRWIDLVWWESMETAKTASDKLMGEAEMMAGMMQLLDSQDMLMLHGTAVTIPVRTNA
jgi:hypothetical protein